MKVALKQNHFFTDLLGHRIATRETAPAQSVCEIIKLKQTEIQKDAEILFTPDLRWVNERASWDQHKIAVLVNEGLEGLAVGVPVDSVFGISERTTVQGEHPTVLSYVDLESLVPKLELTGIKKVFICFLHSYKFPEAEKELAKILGEKEIEAICSHTAGDLPERDRLQTILTQHLVQELFEELATEVKKAFPELSFSLSKNLVNDLGPHDSEYLLRTVSINAQGRISSKKEMGRSPACFGRSQSLTIFDCVLFLGKPDIQKSWSAEKVFKKEHVDKLIEISAKQLQLDRKQFATAAVRIAAHEFLAENKIKDASGFKNLHAAEQSLLTEALHEIT